MKVYVIKNADGEYFIGHCGRFSKDISKARFYKSPKTAIRHYWSRDNYDNLSVIEVVINVSQNNLSITDELYKTYNNLDYIIWKRRKNERQNSEITNS